MSWDTYLFIVLFAAVVGFMLVRSFTKRCPECKSKMKYLGARDPRVGEKKIRIASMFTSESQDYRIEFHFQCENCKTELFTQGSRRRVEKP